MKRRSLPLTLSSLATMVGALFLLAFQPVYPATQTMVLYDASLGSMPDQQGFSYLAIGSSASQQFIDGMTILDSTGSIDDQVGYFSREQLPLDRELGYQVQFTIQIGEEEHLSRHRSGFTLLFLSDDLLGLELAFWEDEVWVQEGGAADDLFRHAEGAAFDTTTKLVDYQLAVLGDTYNLFADDLLILTGSLRDYTAFEGFPDPYETQGLLFLGDNTRRGAARTAIRYVAVETEAVATATATATSTSTATATGTATMEAQPTPSLTATAALPTNTATTAALRTIAPATPTVQAVPAPTPPPENQLYVWLPFLKALLDQLLQ